MSDSGGDKIIRRKAPRVKFSCGTPVHAQASNPQVDFIDVVGINIGGGQSPSMSDIDLFVDIAPGAVEISYEKRHYVLSLRRFRIILEMENARIQVGTKYKAILQHGSFASSDNQTEMSKRELRAEGSAGAEVSAGLTSWLTATLRISGKGTGNAMSDRKVEAQSKTIYQIDLVAPSGQDSWVVGGPEGDPRRNTKDLQGDIIGNDLGERQVPLCGLEAIDVTMPVGGRIRVRAVETDFVLANRKEDEKAISALFEALKDDRDKFIERRVRAERELRARIASLALLKSKRSRRDPKEHDADLASCGFLFEPDVDESKL
jgi:hypothetical protein